MPHRVELSPSGRASCRGCKKAIAKGVPRFAEEVPNPFSDDGGVASRYWHLECAAPRLANALAPALAAFEGEIPDRAAIDSLVADHLKPPMPYAERAPNGRARCRACDESIAKGELRVAFERTFESPMGPQPGQAYAHARCLPRYLEREVERGREALAPAALLAALEGDGRMSKVAEEDRATLRDVLGTKPG